MKQLPHTYSVTVNGFPKNNLSVYAAGLTSLELAPPVQFDGPGDQWSPEELLMASVSSCLVLSFRAIAKASKFEWLSIVCESSGELNKVDKKTKFTSLVSKARLVVPLGANPEVGDKLLNKAEQTCFISNSLSCKTRIECEIIQQ